jgi:hypothetical protein
MSDSTIFDVFSTLHGPVMQAPLIGLFSPSIRHRIHIIYGLIRLVSLVGRPGDGVRGRYVAWEGAFGVPVSGECSGS